MSLILEALKKSEQERRRDKGPDLQTIHQPLPVAAAPRVRYAPWVLLALVVNGAGVGLWWWLQRPPQIAAVPVPAPAPAEQPAQPQRREPVAAVAPPVSAPPPDVIGAPRPAAPPRHDSAEFTRYAPVAETPITAAPAETGAPVRDISEVPDSVRSSLPAMTFSFHVYSADPHKRTIIINNRRLREGDAIDAGVSLQQITEDGVIVAMNEHRIHISVLSGW